MNLSPAHLLYEDGLLSADRLVLLGDELAQNPAPATALAGSLQSRGEQEIRLLLQHGLVSAEALLPHLAAHSGLPTVKLDGHTPAVQVLAQLSRSQAWQWQALPFSLSHDTPPTLTLAVASPPTAERQADISRQLPHVIPRFALTTPAELQRALLRCYPASEVRMPPAGTPSVSQWLEQLFTLAVDQGASDIHWEPDGIVLRIRFRIDGWLHIAQELHVRHWPPLLNRLKVLAGLDIAEHYTAQDGHFVVHHHGEPIDVRLSCMPVVGAEAVVARLLQRSRHLRPLADLGLSPAVQTRWLEAAHQPEGLIVVSGPTGSGKTTTLYALLEQIRHPGISIVTLEEPVEYRLPGLRQTPLAEPVKLDISSGVRALLRQDPDIVLIGELRDSDSAHMALSAAMTGHLVLTTLHARSACGVIARLRALGLPADLLAEQLSLVIGQRLVRRLCPHCRHWRGLQAHERGHPLWQGTPPATLPQPVGCPACTGRGYLGRLIVQETLHPTAALRQAIAAGEHQRHLLCQQVPGFTSMHDHAREHLLAGETTLGEIDRVLGVPESTITTPGTEED